MSEQSLVVLKARLQVSSLWRIIEKMVETLTSDSRLTEVETDFHGMKVLVRAMGPGRIRIDLNE